MKFQKIVPWLMLALLTLATVLVLSHYRFNQENIEIALVAPLTDVGPTISIGGNSMIRGAQLYVEQINEAGGIKGRKIKLRVYDDKNDVKTATEIAHQIVESQALAVIGHYSSGNSLAAGKIYQAYGIPAITGSATADEVTKWNQWYFRSTFSNSDQGLFIANYVKKILDQPQITIIDSSDIYSADLAEIVAREFTNLGGEVVNKWGLKTAQDRDLIIQNLVAIKQQNQDPGVIVITAHRQEAAILIAKMRLYGLDYPIFGGDSLSDISLAQKFVDTPENRDDPGFFTNNIYALTPIIFDISEQTGQDFRGLYKQRFDTRPGWIAAASYDAAKILITAIAESLQDKEKPLAKAIDQHTYHQSRYLVKESLANLQPIDTTIANSSQENHFDSKGNILVSPLVGVFNYDSLTSAYIQLHRILNLKLVNNLAQQIEQGSIIQVGSEYMLLTHVVYTGVDINQVSSIDEKSSSYLLDFYLWFRYQGEDLHPEDIEFSNYNAEAMDSGETLTLDEPLEEKRLGKSDYKLFRMKASFKEQFKFQDYPFDNQTLAVRFRHRHLTKVRLLYAVDNIGMEAVTTPEILAKWEQGQVFDEISDWIVRKVSFYPDTLINQSTLGDRRFVNTDAKIKYSRFNAAINITRNTVSFTIKELLPLLFFVVVSYLVLFLPFENISIDAVSGILLAVVFYHLSLIEKLPDGVGYVVTLDYAFYLTYGLLGLELLLVTIGHSKFFGQETTKIKQLMIFSRVAFPTCLAMSVAILFWKYF
ncbi:ABC-type branched-chain amino acid transport system, periplasmic component [Xenococcus sp. PCC 7305]|uniref:ABC transporter substrate-binding protein n=1 Tax=Xenococcus sp. PCC 7305 TaxID=102125 RepID=UPI0002ABB92F|nr:ABC transporter substrate-binding protein [Xenococcus sp. PCC 7305]ELS00313.1 ABC-type branched-chain amino acid transport system, periplasmic component [Xenococcus sp. PCC 7305]